MITVQAPTAPFPITLNELQVVGLVSKVDIPNNQFQFVTRDVFDVWLSLGENWQTWPTAQFWPFPRLKDAAVWFRMVIVGFANVRVMPLYVPAATLRLPSSADSVCRCSSSISSGP